MRPGSILVGRIGFLGVSQTTMYLGVSYNYVYRQYEAIFLKDDGGIDVRPVGNELTVDMWVEEGQLKSL
jgi:hypothetical protein